MLLHFKLQLSNYNLRKKNELDSRKKSKYVEHSMNANFNFCKKIYDKKYFLKHLKYNIEKKQI